MIKNNFLEKAGEKDIFQKQEEITTEGALLKAWLFFFFAIFAVVTCADLLRDFLMCIHFQHSSTVHTLMNWLDWFSAVCCQDRDRENTIFMCHGIGAKQQVAVWIWCCFSSCSDVWSQPRWPMSAGQVTQRLQDLETVVVKQLDRALSKVQNGIALCWTTVTTTIDQVLDTRVLGKVDKWNSSGKAWSKWSLVRAYDVAVHQQLSGAEISTDVCSCMSSWSCCAQEELGIVLWVQCTAGAWRHGECSVMRIPCGTMRQRWQACERDDHEQCASPDGCGVRSGGEGRPGDVDYLLMWSSPVKVNRAVNCSMLEGRATCQKSRRWVRVLRTLWLRRACGRCRAPPQWCTVLCLNQAVQVRPVLWRSWDLWSADLSQVLLMWRQRVSADSERSVAKRWSSSMSWWCSWRSRNPRTRVRLRFRVRLMPVQSCWILWTDLTKSSLEWLTELSKLVLCIAYLKSSEMVPETRGVSEVCRGNRLWQR